MFINQLNKYYESRIYKELESEAVFIDKLIQGSGIDILDEIKTENRITLIKKDGSVYYDNQLKPSALPNLENHNSRKEIIEAHMTGKGLESRYSETMLEKTLYFALETDNQNIVRISSEQHSVGALIIGLSRELISMFIIAAIVTIITAFFISKKITTSLNKINLDDPEKSDVFTELKPFTKRISEQNMEKAQQETLRQQFTANVSHELKTPLTGISGFAELLKDCVKNDSIDKKTIVDFSSSIFNECQRMISLVNDIIKLSKLDENSIFQEKEEISLKDITNNIIKTIKPVADKKNIDILLSGDNGNIVGVYSVIYEMIFNLCDNAVKYNKENGKVYIKINTDSSNHKVQISVKDTGIGFSEKDKERIFERFYRVDKSRSKESGGTGLGLSIVKHGAKYHNAKVKVTSKLGEGSEFTILFNK